LLGDFITYKNRPIKFEMDIKKNKNKESEAYYKMISKYNLQRLQIATLTSIMIHGLLSFIFLIFFSK
jgi:hypothetical protein